MAYSVIERHIWHDEKFRSLSRNARDLFLYLLTSPHSNRLGMYVLDRFYVASDLQMEPAEVDVALAELKDCGRVDYDPTARLVLIRRFLRHNPLKNPNVVKAACDDLSKLPFSKRLWKQLSESVTRWGKARYEPLHELLREPLGDKTLNQDPDPDPTPEPTEEDANASLSGSDFPNPDVVAEIFEHWRTASGHTKATLTDGRRRKIAARLKRYDAQELRRAIDGALANPFFRGQNDTGQRYDWPETVLKNDEVVERHIEYLDAERGNVDDMKRMLKTGGTMLQMPTTRDAAFAEIAQALPELWQRSGDTFRRLPFGELLELRGRDYELTKRIEGVLRSEVAA